MRQRPRLYLISPPHFEIEDFKDQLKLAISGGDIAVFQLRMKSKSADGSYNSTPDEALVRKAIEALHPIVKEHNIVFILNDNPKLVAEYKLDGVHLGVDDMKIEAARKIVGEDKIIGISCYDNKDRAFEAGEAGANYVAFGAFYDTQTKTPKGRPTLDLLDFWQKFTNTPCVAIGGIKVSNCRPIIEFGADFIAVVTGVWNYELGPKQAVMDFNQIIDEVYITVE
jgi:thiamine-phosphate pyrophosphorylase